MSSLALLLACTGEPPPPEVQQVEPGVWTIDGTTHRTLLAGDRVEIAVDDYARFERGEPAFSEHAIAVYTAEDGSYAVEALDAAYLQYAHDALSWREELAQYEEQCLEEGAFTPIGKSTHGVGLRRVTPESVEISSGERPFRPPAVGACWNPNWKEADEAPEEYPDCKWQSYPSLRGSYAEVQHLVEPPETTNVMLWLHGTALQSWPGFRGIDEATVALWSERYPAGVLAFDHRATADSPCDNLVHLREELDRVATEAGFAGQGLHLRADVLAISRGGLLARMLDLPDPTLDEQCGQDVLGPHRVEIERLAMVSTPNAGSALVALGPALGIGDLPTAKELGCTYHAPISDELVPKQLQVVPAKKLGKRGPILPPGGKVQKATSDFLAWLNEHAGPRAVASTLVIASDFRVHQIWGDFGPSGEARARSEEAYELFGGANDLIVSLRSSFLRGLPAKGAQASSLVPATHVRLVGPGTPTTHPSLFMNDEVRSCLDSFFGNDGQVPDDLCGLLRPACSPELLDENGCCPEGTPTQDGPVYGLCEAP